MIGMIVFFVERIEFAHVKAVHSVICGPLGRGISSSSRWVALGKADLGVC